MAKKAQGLTLNTIIIAALVLLVLVILALIFTGRIQIFGSETAACENNGGTCKDSCVENEAEYRAAKCPAEQVCCVAAETPPPTPPAEP